MERFLASAIPVYVMAAITVLGVLATWATGIYYRQMMNQTENMMSVRHPFLQQMKNRFENTYRMNKGINDIPLFVERQLKGNRFLWIRADRVGKASWKAALLCLILGGAVTMLQQINGFEVREVVTSLAITLFCAIVGFGVYYLSDVEETQNQLRIHLEEYFVNTMSKRVVNVREEEKILTKSEGKKKRNAAADKYFSDVQEKRDSETGSVKQDTEPEADHFTEEDLQYLRQSLERIAAGRDRNLGSDKKHHFSAKEEKIIDDILKEYFV